jgi:undecaprenyl-diphosphatase
MSLLQALFLGALQGVTEFLPVSSSGHLVISRTVLGLTEIPLLFDVLLHVSTLCVVLIVFRKKIGALLASLGRFIVRKSGDEDRTNLRIILVIIVATIPTALMGLGISFLDMETHPRVVSVLFIVTGAILVGAHFTKGEKGYVDIGVREGVLTGIAQGLGVFAGISRSGITISGALFAGIRRENAGEYSFLIAIPAIVGAFVFELKDAGELLATVSPGSLSVGVVSSFVVGLVSLLFLLRLVRQGKLFVFSFYLVPLGILSLILL